MEWTDQAIVLGARRQGEGSLVVTLLTAGHGLQRGLVRGAARNRAPYEPGSRAIATWKARLAEHLGLVRLEPLGSAAALALDDPLRLACLEAATTLAEATLPERAAHPAAHAALARLLAAIECDQGYAAEHLRFELDLLADLGFGLDLAACAVTGATADLAFVSPRTGRAVSRAGAGAYADRLLVLPRLLGGTGSGGGALQDLLDGLALTGFFLDQHALAPAHQILPPARGRYLDRLRRVGGDTGL